MTDYIEREAALNATFKIPAKILSGRIKTARNAVQAYANYIASLPAADVKPVVHGHWVMEDYDYPCSVCGETVDYEYDVRVLKYCPYCGARMVKDEDKTK